MRYSLEPKYKKYDMPFWHITVKKNTVKKLIYTATKTILDAAKTASKRVLQKTAEATGNLIGIK